MSWQVWLVLSLLALTVGYRLWQRRGVERVSVHEVKARLGARDRMLIIDVREPSEFKAGHIPGAVNIPLGSLPKLVSTLDRQAETILVCRSGNRSLSAYHQLKALGFTDLKNLEGGMLRWPWETAS